MLLVELKVGLIYPDSELGVFILPYCPLIWPILEFLSLSNKSFHLVSTPNATITLLII
jgi:hypothetical protein